MQRLRLENSELRQQIHPDANADLTLSVHAELPDLEAIKDRILKDLKLGKQAPGHKAAVKALDRFISELR